MIINSSHSQTHTLQQHHPPKKNHKRTPNHNKTWPSTNSHHGSLGREGGCCRYSSKQAFHQEMGQRVGGGQVMSLGKAGRSSTIWVVGWRMFFWERKSLVEHSMSFTAHAAFFWWISWGLIFIRSSFFFPTFGGLGGRVGWQQGKTSTDFFLIFFLRFTETCGPNNNNSGTSFFSPDLVMLPQAYDVPEIKFFVMDSWTTDFRFSPLDSSLKMHFFS